MQDALITLTGNVGSEVEVSEGAGWVLARFRLACTPRRLVQGTWVDRETTWVNVNAWGRTAQNIRTSIRKGDPLVVSGKLRTTAWQDAEGVRHERLVVEATALGHDLSRGVAVFERNPRAVLEGDAVVDPVTGEVLRQADPPARPDDDSSCEPTQGESTTGPVAEDGRPGADACR